MAPWLYLQLHLLVALLATTAVFGRLISMPAPALVVWRTLLAMLGGALLLTLGSRRKLLPPPGRLLPLIGIGAIIGLHWMCFFGAIKLANISICLAGMATVSFFTALTEPFFERRRIRPVEIALGLLVVAGVLLVAGFERGRLPGLGVALVGALLAAVFPVLNRRLVRGMGPLEPLVIITWEMLGACLACLVTLPWLEGAGAYGRLFRWHGLDWLWLLLLAWPCTIFAHAAFVGLLRHLSAYTTNLAINFESIYGILAAVVVFGEHRQLHPGFFLGAGALLAANLLHPLLLRAIERRKLAEDAGPGEALTKWNADTGERGTAKREKR